MFTPEDGQELDEILSIILNLVAVSPNRSKDVVDLTWFNQRYEQLTSKWESWQIQEKYANDQII